MTSPARKNSRTIVGPVAVLSACALLLAACGPPAPARGSKQADVWYCFAMDRTGKKWAYKAPNIEDASVPAMKACKAESVEPSTCQMPEDSNCSNTGFGNRID
ncbi:MAG: hypothetical protein AAF942_11750 [Pseudomonadota bacterium]